MTVTNTTNDYLPGLDFFITVMTFNSLGIIIGVAGNIMVISYNIWTVKSKLPTTYFVISLAVTDLFVCSTCYSAWLTELSLVVVDESIFGHELFCKTGFTSLGTGVALSIANLLAITVDRFIYISKPLKYPLIMTWTKTYVILCSIYLAAFANAFFVYYNTGKDTRIFYCTNPLYVVMIFFTLFAWIPIAGILIFNYKIFKVARNQRRKIQSENCFGAFSSSVNSEAIRDRRRSWLQQLKQVRTFAIIVAAMLVVIIPAGIVVVVEKFICKYCLPTSVYLFSLNVFGVNCIINPVIYTVRSKEYRTAIRLFLFKIINRSN